MSKAPRDNALVADEMIYSDVPYLSGAKSKDDLDKAFEMRQNFLLNKLASSPEDIKDVLSCNVLRHSRIEHWIHSKYGVRFDFVTRGPHPSGMEAGYYCARFDPAPESLLSNDAPSRSFIACDLDLNGRGIEGRDGDHWRAVLVPIIDGSELHQPFGFRPLPAVVRLYAFNDRQNLWRNAGHTRSLHAAKLLTGAGYRELYEALFAWRRPRKGEGHMVECRAEMMGRFSDEDRHHRGHRPDISESEGEPIISICLSHDGMGLRLEESFGNLINYMSINSCPPEFESNLTDGIGH
jgi:hypothetical protein